MKYQYFKFFLVGIVLLEIAYWSICPYHGLVPLPNLTWEHLSKKKKI
jgi:hypothetical protein